MENKEKIRRLRAQIAKLQGMLKQTKDPELKKRLERKINSMIAEIQSITDVGNGDGSGRKPISPSTDKKNLYK